MSKEETMVERLSLIACQHMDAFMPGGEHRQFPRAPATADWADYSPREQAAGRSLVGALIDALVEPEPINGEISEIIRELREYADYRATPDALSHLLWRAADALTSSSWSALSKAKEGTGE